MRAYIIKRLLLIVPTMFIVSLIVFSVIRLIPGNIIDLMMTEGTGGAWGIVDRAAIEEAMGLDVPILTQYGRWVGVVPQTDGSFSGALQGDLGKSLWTRTPVTTEVADRWQVTVELGLFAMIVALLIALPVGIYSALRQDTWGDYIARSFAILCIAIPGFWLGTLIIVFFSIWWGYSPSLALFPFTEDPVGNLKMFILPAIVLGMILCGGTMRMTRTMMLEVLRQDYVRTAWAKGLRERVVILRHALKNALIPVISVIGVQVRIIIGGTVIIEEVFNLPGLGRLVVSATLERDYTLLSGVMLLIAAAVVSINLVVDLTYAYLDPRIQYK